MNLRSMILRAATILIGLARIAGAGEPRPGENGPVAAKEMTLRPSEGEIRAAVGRSLSLLESSMKRSARSKGCFTCHNQAVPILALDVARERGFVVDAEEIREMLKMALDLAERGVEDHREGRVTEGGADRMGYSLWILSTRRWQLDDVTAAASEFLIGLDPGLDHWRSFADRPPSVGSNFTTTFVTMAGLKAFGTPEQQGCIADRVARAKAWLLKAEAKDNEDRVFHLRALRLVGADEESIRSAAAQLEATQHADCGWSQLDGGASDAYATGSTLVALNQCANLATRDPVYGRGLAFLLRAQVADGSWHVKTRSRPIQKYFESGYPHGKDQFISVAAGAWATALLLDLPR
jgi:hypothetical protein